MIEIYELNKYHLIINYKREILQFEKYNYKIIV